MLEKILSEIKDFPWYYDNCNQEISVSPENIVMAIVCSAPLIYLALYIFYHGIIKKDFRNEESEEKRNVEFCKSYINRYIRYEE